MRILVLVSLLFSFSVFGEDYVQIYEKGAAIIEMGNCMGGLPWIQQAIEVQSKGNLQRNYFPHYYLALCALQNGDFDAAEKYSKQALGSGITFSGKAKDFADFKNRLKQAKKEAEGRLSLSIIVHPSNPVTNLTLDQIKKIYRGEQKAWENGVTIVPILGAAGSRENKFFLSRIESKTEKDLHELWKKDNPVAKHDLPFLIADREALLRYVKSTPGAIAFLSSSSAGEQVKMVPVDEKTAEDEDYVFKTSKP